MLKLLLFFLIYPIVSFSQSETTVIRNVNIVDVESGTLLTARTVLIEQSRIRRIGKDIRIPKNARIIDGKGKYLIPGLVDFNAGVLNYEYSGEPALSLMLVHGITSVRDLQPKVPLSFGVQLKRELQTGFRVGPRLYLVSYLITSRGAREKKIVIQTADQAKAAVDSSLAAGADVIKLDYTLSPSVMTSVISRARHHGLPTVGGITTSFIEASNAGINMIDHASDLRRVTTKNRELFFNFYRNDSSRIVSREEFYNRVLPSLGTVDSLYFREVISTMKKNNTWLVISPASQMPSIQKFEIADTGRYQYKTKRQLTALKKAKEDNEKIAHLERYKTFVDMSEIKWAHDLGLDIVAGSQMYEFMTPGFSLHDSFYWMQKNGFDPIEILRIATINPARFMKRENELGSIREGKLADFVLLNSNPLLDIGNLKDISAVMVNGRLIERKALDSILEEIRKKAKQL